MFCSHCGNQVADNSAFCPACGKSLNANAVAPVDNAAMQAQYQQYQQMQEYQMQQFQMQKNTIRQSEISSLNQAFNYFYQKKAEFDAYDEACNMVNYYSQGAKSGLIVWGAIIASIGLISSLSYVEHQSAGGLFAILCCTVFPAIAMIFGGIKMKVNNRKNLNHYQEEYSRLSQELYTYYTNYPGCPIGPEYANPDIITLIMEVLRSGRADTIKEAINVLIADANQADMDEYLLQIQQNTEAINTRTKVAAIFAAASFFR